MGNHLWRVSQNSSEESVKSIKVVDSEGRVTLLQQRRMNVSEIMQRYPQNVVARADSFYIGQKMPILSAEAKLEGGKSYFLLPEKMSGSVSSAAWLASLATGGSKVAMAMAISPLHRSISSAKSVEPFQIEKSEDGRVQLKISPEFIHKLLEDGKMSSQSNEDGSSTTSYSGLCTSPQLQKDYTLLVKDRAQLWRPNLQTIHEKEKKCKLFRLKRRCRT